MLVFLTGLMMGVSFPPLLLASANMVLLDFVKALLLESLRGIQMENLLEYGFVHMLWMDTDLVHSFDLYLLSWMDTDLDLLREILMDMMMDQN